MSQPNLRAGLNTFLWDLVYFTTPVPDTSKTSATQVGHACDTSVTQKTAFRNGRMDIPGFLN